jgi:TonB-linked SusC/RagA family outer membrane protein
MIKPLLFVLIAAFVTPISAQQIIKGRVTDASSGDPLAGVNIQIKDTNYGAVSDLDGYYELPLPGSGGQFFSRKAPPPVLVVTYTGFETREIEADDQRTLNIELSSAAAALTEVVVTGTAVGRSEKLLSYSVGRVAGPELTAVPSANLGAGLQARVPGLRVSRPGGQPGQDVYFQIRSANALANGQQPLVILDGIFLSNGSLADIPVEDVERVEILKGSAGASLYGSQAANGVIQVFTKRGRSLEIGETKVSYRNETGFSEIAEYYPLNTLTQRTIVDPGAPQPILGAPNEGQTFSQELPNLQNYQEDLLFQRGILQSHALIVQGKTNATNFLTSFQRLQDKGILQGLDGYTRNALRLNLDHQISNKLTLQLSSLYTQAKQDLIDPVANGPNNFLSATLLMTPMFTLGAPNEEDGSAYDWDIDNTGANITNPLYTRSNISSELSRNRFLAQAGANYFIKDWLNISYSAALDRSSRNFLQYLEKGYLSTSVPTGFGTLATASTNSKGGGILQRDQIDQTFISRADLKAERKWSGFNLATRLGFLYEDISREMRQSSGENLAVRDLHSLDNAQSNISIGSAQQEIVAYSGFLVADMDYKQKYLFSGLLRREGSSLFGPEQRWANYYRVSGAYRITEDLKLKPFKELKLRASMGTAGIRPTYDQRFESFSLVNGELTKNTLGNELLQPALSTEQEIGLDATIGRAFRLEFNFSRITTEDQILLVPLTAAAGFRGQWRNAGSLEAKVYEAGLHIDFTKLFRIGSGGVRWDLYTTFDRTRQTVTSLDVPAYYTGPGAQQASLFVIEAGKPLGVMEGEIFATSLDQLQDQEGIDPGDYGINEMGYVVRLDQMGTPEEVPYKLRDAGGNPLVDVIGDINPDFRMGFAHTLAFRGLELYTLFDWKKGGSIYNATKQWLYKDMRHAEVSAYPDIAANFYGSNGLYNALVANNHFVEDGSFFMLREASLSLMLRRKQLGGLFSKLDHIRLSLIGRNVFTNTKYSGFHPDVSSVPRSEAILSTSAPDARGGDLYTPNGDPSLFLVDSFNYPLPRTFSFSVEVGF